jgi:hypothetical protein
LELSIEGSNPAIGTGKDKKSGERERKRERQRETERDRDRQREREREKEGEQLLYMGLTMLKKKLCNKLAQAIWFSARARARAKYR